MRNASPIMKEKDIPLVTTLSVALGLADMKNLPDFMMKKAVSVKESAMNSFRMAHEAGIRVALGTDYSNTGNTPFKHIGKEFYSLTRCGYTPMEAIKAGTVNGRIPDAEGSGDRHPGSRKTGGPGDRKRKSAGGYPGAGRCGQYLHSHDRREDCERLISVLNESSIGKGREDPARSMCAGPSLYTAIWVKQNGSVK